MPRAARRVLVWVFAIQVLWSGVTAVIMAVLWRGSIDEPDVSYSCDGGTCYDGPTTYLILMLVFGGICLVFVMIIVLMTARWRAAAARRARLVATGVRVPALLARIDATGTEVNGRNVRKLTFEARPGGRVVQAFERSTALIPLGTRATIAYDPADLTNAAVVEDIEALGAAAARHAEREQQAFVEAMFAAGSPTPPVPPMSPRPSSLPGLSAVRDAVAQNMEAALAELAANRDRGAITQQEYDQQRDLLMRMLEMPTDPPLT